MDAKKGCGDCLRCRTGFAGPGSTLQKTRTFFEETQIILVDIPKDSSRIPQNPEHPCDLDFAESSKILEKSLESSGIPRNG